MRRPALVVSCVLVALASALPAGAQVPSHPSELSYSLLDFTAPESADHRHELSNGVVVFAVEDHELPLVSISVTVRTGPTTS